MHEAISTRNLVALPIAIQELDRGVLFCPPTKIGLSNSPTTIELKVCNVGQACRVLLLWICWYEIKDLAFLIYIYAENYAV